MGDSSQPENVTQDNFSAATIIPPTEDETFEYQLSFLESSSKITHGIQRIQLSPIFAGRALQTSSASQQFGLLAGASREKKISTFQDDSRTDPWKDDPRVFFNVTTPSSTFICGSQGSGKSHTLSCMLENCLIPSKLGNLPKPLTGVVFHYDTFISDAMGSPCEAAFLSSNPDLKVRVLCPPTNIRSARVSQLRRQAINTFLIEIQLTYSRFNIDVHPLEIDQQHLNTKRMLDLMAVEPAAGNVPLYMCTVQRILREMRISQQQSGSAFDYASFKSQVLESGLTPGQLEPLKQRLDTLESFMPQAQTVISFQSFKKSKGSKPVGTSWKPEVPNNRHFLNGEANLFSAKLSYYHRPFVSLYFT